MNTPSSQESKICRCNGHEVKLAKLSPVIGQPSTHRTQHTIDSAEMVVAVELQQFMKGGVCRPRHQVEVFMHHIQVCEGP